MFGGSNTPGVGSAASLRVAAVLCCSRGFDFSGMGVCSSVESRSCGCAVGWFGMGSWSS